MEHSEESAQPYVLTKPQQELVDRLGITIAPGLDKAAVNKAIDKAVNARVAKVCEANPALKKDGFIIVDGVTRKISQIRGHRVCLSGGGLGTKWVTFFDIEDVEAAPTPE